jgi:hypothetical protein
MDLHETVSDGMEWMCGVSSVTLQVIVRGRVRASADVVKQLNVKDMTRRTLGFIEMTKQPCKST